MNRISAVVLTKNEEKLIGKCLTNLTWCDEIIVIDDDSTDNTASEARKYKAKVFKRSLNGDFSAQRNFGLEKAKGNWILFIDADEIVTDPLASEIKKKTKSTRFNGFLANRKLIFMDKKMNGGEWGGIWLLRLAKKESGKWERAVHEEWRVKGSVGKLSSPLLHSPTNSLSEFVQKINFYSQIHARSNETEGKSSNLIKVIFWPFFKFINNYLFKRGYKDGVHGFVYAAFMSFHSYLAWSNQWIKSQKTK